MEFNMEILQTGITILSVGFFTVFLFLSVLIFAMGIMGRVVSYLNKIFPVEAAVPAAASKKSAASEDEEIAVAIAAVLMR